VVPPENDHLIRAFSERVKGKVMGAEDFLNRAHLAVARVAGAIAVALARRRPVSRAMLREWAAALHRAADALDQEAER
jgi:hypothetical protein